MKTLRFWTVVALLAVTAFLLNSRSKSEPHVARQTLSAIPSLIEEWTGSDQSIDRETLDVLGPGEFLSRLYVRDNQTPPISLFVAYFPSQRTGVTIHSPRHCLPGAGWAFESSSYVLIEDAGGVPHQVGEYIIGNGSNKQFVIYWYEAHGRSIASEYAAKFYLVADAIRMNRSDGALVRVITPVASGETTPAAKARAESFVTQLLPMLPRFIPH